MQKRNGIYYLEYSASGTQWKTYADGAGYTTVSRTKARNTIVRNTIFEEIPPTKCRFVRLTMKQLATHHAARDHRAHGFLEADGSLPATQPISEAR